MSYLDKVVLKRSLYLWWGLPVGAGLALMDWHDHVTGTRPHGFRYSYGDGYIALAIAISGIIYDVYLRLIRQDRLEFSEIGILDLASSDRLGEIRWEAVETVTIKPSLAGAYIAIGFKDGVPLSDHVEQWDSIRIGPMTVSADDQKNILQMAAERKINSAIEP